MAYQVESAAFSDPAAEAHQRRLAAEMAARKNVAAPMVQGAQAGATTINQVPQGQFREDQRSLAADVAARASGQGPSLAQMQLQRGTDAAIAAQASGAASARGVSPGLAARMAAQNSAQIMGQGANDAAALRLQEQTTAQNQLAGILGAGREQDIGLATQQANLSQGLSLANAGFQQQAGIANQGATLQNQAGIDSMTQWGTGQQIGLTQSEADRAMKEEELNQQAWEARLGANAQIRASQPQEQSWKDRLMGVATTAAGVGLGRALTSDKNLKTDIKDGKKTSSDFLEAVKAHRFKYKGEDVEHLGVMAQDIEKAPGGKGMVIDTPHGKVIDVPQATGRLLAATATLHERIKKLEAKRIAKKGAA